MVRFVENVLVPAVLGLWLYAAGYAAWAGLGYPGW